MGGVKSASFHDLGRVYGVVGSLEGTRFIVGDEAAKGVGDVALGREVARLEHPRQSRHDLGVGHALGAVIEDAVGALFVELRRRRVDGPH